MDFDIFWAWHVGLGFRGAYVLRNELFWGTRSGA